MKATQIMRRRVPRIESSENLSDALEMMDDFGLSELPVVEDDQFVGVITAEAIHQASRKLGPFEEIPDRPVAELIVYGTTCKPKEEGFHILDHMEQYDSRHSYVVGDQGQLLGEVDIEDLVEALPSEVSAGKGPRGWTRWQPGEGSGGNHAG